MEDRLKEAKRYATLGTLFWGLSLLSLGFLAAALALGQSASWNRSLRAVCLVIGLVGPWLFLFLSIVFRSKCSRIQAAIVKEISQTFENPSDALAPLGELGIRRGFAQSVLREEIRRYNSQRENSQREAIIATAVLRCKEVLGEIKKPKNCNEVYLQNANGFFDDLESFQAKATWEVWRSEDRLCFYAAQVKGYPSYSAQGPYAFVLDLSDIQYYRVSGSVKSEVQISGGTVKQDKRTGRVTQTPLKTRTVERDERLCDLTLRQNGVVSHLLFDAADFDVFFALIPEKSYTKVTGTGN